MKYGLFLYLCPKILIMSKKILSFSVFSFFALFCIYGQDDAYSQKIIDDMVAKFKTYSSVSLNFSANITLQDRSETEQEGTIWLKNNKYKLEISDDVIYYDGSKIYHYMPKVKEVTINKPDPEDDSEDFQLLNPSSYFNLSSKSFKSKLIKESTQDNRKVYEIDLYPVQIKNANYTRIRIMIEKSTLQMVYLKAILNDGTHYTLSFKPYNKPQPVLRDSFFTFNIIEHPGVEVIDLTF